MATLIMVHGPRCPCALLPDVSRLRIVQLHWQRHCSLIHRPRNRRIRMHRPSTPPPRTIRDGPTSRRSICSKQCLAQHRPLRATRPRLGVRRSRRRPRRGETARRDELKRGPLPRPAARHPASAIKDIFDVFDWPTGVRLAAVGQQHRPPGRDRGAAAARRPGRSSSARR